MEFFNNILSKYGLSAGFIFMAIENIGIPFPIEFVYIYGQNLVNMEQQSFWFLTIFFTLGHTFGASISYMFGYYGNSFFTIKYQNNRKAQRTKTNIERWYKKYGEVTSFMVRFIGYVRPWSSFFAGFGKQKFGPFFVYTFLGSLIFNIIVLIFSGLIIDLWSNFQWAKYLIFFCFVFFFVGIWFIFPWIKRKFFSKIF